MLSFYLQLLEMFAENSRMRFSIEFIDFFKTWSATFYTSSFSIGRFNNGLKTFFLSYAKKYIY